MCGHLIKCFFFLAGNTKVFCTVWSLINSLVSGAEKKSLCASQASEVVDFMRPHQPHKKQHDTDKKKVGKKRMWMKAEGKQTNWKKSILRKEIMNRLPKRRMFLLPMLVKYPRLLILTVVIVMNLSDTDALSDFQLQWCIQNPFINIKCTAMWLTFLGTFLSECWGWNNLIRRGSTLWVLGLKKALQLKSHRLIKEDIRGVFAQSLPQREVGLEEKELVLY